MGEPATVVLVGLIISLIILLGAILSQPVNQPSPEPSGPCTDTPGIQSPSMEILTIEIMDQILITEESRVEAVALMKDLSRMLSEPLTELHPGIVMNFTELGETLGFKILNEDGSEPYDMNKAISIRHPA